MKIKIRKFQKGMRSYVYVHFHDREFFLSTFATLSYWAARKTLAIHDHFTEVYIWILH